MNTHSVNTVNVTWQIRVSGRVQGVGYRNSCVRYAQANEIRGWVRNRHDGSVELTIQGLPISLAAMRTWLQKMVPGAHVTDIDAKLLDKPAEPFKSFERWSTT